MPKIPQGQYDEVLREEVPQLYAAFQAVDAENLKYRPTLTVIICGKRHRARFFPSASTDTGAENSRNTCPGTVVDKGVASVVDFDFYLQAHAGGLHSAPKSTHYVVIYDESAITPDAVQQGVHSASYLYARTNSAVSLVPPAYYADILCDRARCWIEEYLLAEDSAGGKILSLGQEKLEADRVFEAVKCAWGDGLHYNLRDSMFYI